MLPLIILHAVLGLDAHTDGGTVFWTLPANVSSDYAAKALAFSLQGLANRGPGEPRLFINTSALDFDFPGSDDAWRRYLAADYNVTWEREVDGLCALVQRFRGVARGLVVYPDDGWSVFVALTMAGLDDLLPASTALLRAFPCLAAALPVARDFTANATLQWPDKMAAHRWAVAHLLPRCSASLLFNANMGPNANAGQDIGTILSVDFPVAERAFVMNLCPLWECDTSPNSTDLNCGPHSKRVATPDEAALFAAIVAGRDELVSVWGWSDPEHAYTNVTAHAGGVVFCTFSTPNLSFWRRLGLARGLAPLPLPAHHDSGRALDGGKVYVTFETNEGDTPRILTSQFTSAWVSPNRGSVPVAWAVDPLLGLMFPALWNFYAADARFNDTFVAGVDGAGYVFVAELGAHEAAYERRAGRVLAQMGGQPNVVDTGVAQGGWADVATHADLARYAANANAGAAAAGAPAGTPAVAAFVNACGSHWGQQLNGYLPDGTPVINSVCYGPPATDTSNGHYLYYYRDHLNATDAEGDLAARIMWAAAQQRGEQAAAAAAEGEEEGEEGASFILVFGGLGLYGGHDDFHLFLQRVMGRLAAARPGVYEAVGAQEMARLAREAGAVQRQRRAAATAADESQDPRIF